MLKYTFSVLLVSALVLGTSGCSGIKPEPIAPKSLNKVDGGKLSLNIIKDLDDKVIEDAEIKNLLIKYISAQSKYPIAQPNRECFQNLGGGTTCNTYEKGAKFNYTNGELIISYVNGMYINPTYSVSFKMPVSYVRTTDKINIDFQYPTEAVSKNGYLAFVKAQPYDKEDNLIADVENIYKKISKAPDVMYVTRQFVMHGEINSNYNDTSTYANFERLLGKYNWGETKPSNVDIAKGQTFSLKMKDGRIVPLHVVVFPYKNASKIIYDVILPYQVYLNGNITLNKQEATAYITKEVTRIAND